MPFADPSDRSELPDSIGRFASDLRILRLESGNPTLQALSAATGISSSVISEAFSGKRLPTEKTVSLLVGELGSDPQEWLRRRFELDPRAQKNVRVQEEPAPPSELAPSGSLRPGKLVLVCVATALLSAAVTSGGWAFGMQQREAYWQAQLKAPLGEQFLEPVDGADPMRTVCREDKVIADVQMRDDDQFKVEMLYSNSCMGVWGRVTRYDGQADGNTVSFRIYPAADPDSPRAQERSADDVNSLYTPLLIEPEVEARVCGIATATRDGEEIELGPPLCI